MAAQFTPDKPVVSAEWLRSHLSAPDVRVLDCSWFMPDAPQTGRQIYDAHHIPGARFFDIDDVSDTDSSLPHMLPSPEKFSSRVRRLGLGDGHRVICYDQNGFLASARATTATWPVEPHDPFANLNSAADLVAAEEHR